MKFSGYVSRFVYLATLLAVLFFLPGAANAFGKHGNGCNGGYGGCNGVQASAGCNGVQASAGCYGGSGSCYGGHGGGLLGRGGLFRGGLFHGGLFHRHQAVGYAVVASNNVSAASDCPNGVVCDPPNVSSAAQPMPANRSNKVQAPRP